MLIIYDYSVKMLNFNLQDDNCTPLTYKMIMKSCDEHTCK